MSIVFQDPQLPARLPSRNVTLDFTVVGTDPDALVMSLKYPDGRMETLYQAGIVGAQYSVVRDGAENRAFHVVRKGGWPSGPFSLPITEAALPPAPSSTTWSTLYERDLRTLPTQSISGASESNTYANFTLDGQPWYYHTSTGKVNLVNGQGLVGTAGGYNFPGGNPYGGIHFGLKVYQMPGYDPNKESICQVIFGGGDWTSGTLPIPAHVGADIWSGGEVWGYGPGNNTQQVRLNVGSVLFTDGQTKALGGKAGPGEQFSNFCLATRTQPFDLAGGTSGKKNYRSGYFLRDVAGLLPDPEAMIGLGCENGLGTAQASSYKMGFYVGNTVAGLVNFTAIKIRLLQRAVT